MTDTPDLHPLDTPKPYAAPQLHELGTIGAVTAGPNDGVLDQLGGASGGWIVNDGTS